MKPHKIRSIANLKSLLVLTVLSSILSSYMAYAAEPWSDSDTSLIKALRIYKEEDQRNQDTNYEETNNYKQSLAALDQVVASYPDTEAALIAKLIKGYIQTGDGNTPSQIDAGIALLNDVIKMAPKSWQSVVAQIYISQVTCSRAAAHEYSLKTGCFQPTTQSAAEYKLVKESMKTVLVGLPLISDKAWRPLRDFGGFPPEEELAGLAHVLIGIASNGLGDINEANNELQFVLAKYPHTEAAKNSVTMLDEMGIRSDAKIPRDGRRMSRKCVSLKQFANSKAITAVSQKAGREMILESSGILIVFSAESKFVECNGRKLEMHDQAKLIGGELYVQENFANNCIKAIQRRNIQHQK
jgi:hypothetical protein